MANNYKISVTLADTFKVEASSPKEAVEEAKELLGFRLNRGFKAYIQLVQEVPGEFFDPETNCFHSNSFFVGTWPVDIEYDE